MKNITTELKRQIQIHDSIQERLDLLKDKYSGEVAYVVTCGPTLNNYNHNKLNEILKDKLVIALKQSYDVVGDVADFHIMNTYNLKSYDWNDKNIVFWTVSKSYTENQLNRIVDNKWPIDLYVPVINPPYIDRSQTTAFTKNFDNFKKLSTDTEVVWGPGTMYELGISLPIHLGCKKIVTIGWDLGNPTENWIDDDGKHQHFYKQKPDCVPQPGEIQEVIDSTEHLYGWFVENEIDFNIISDINPACNKLKRIKLEDI
jgi:hypothetical protein